MLGLQRCLKGVHYVSVYIYTINIGTLLHILFQTGTTLLVENERKTPKITLALGKFHRKQIALPRMGFGAVLPVSYRLDHQHSGSSIIIYLFVHMKSKSANQ